MPESSWTTLNSIEKLALVLARICQVEAAFLILSAVLSLEIDVRIEFEQLSKNNLTEYLSKEVLGSFDLENFQDLNVTASVVVNAVFYPLESSYTQLLRFLSKI